MKTIAILRWAFYAICLQIILVPYAYFFFPLVYSLRNNLRRDLDENGIPKKWWQRVLWILLDDEEYKAQGHDYGPKWWRDSKRIKIDNKWQKFKAAYKWGVIRNPAWNQYYLFKPLEGEKEEIVTKGELTQGGHRVNILAFAVLKYVDEEGNYMDNKGEYLSLNLSILGHSMVWYKIGGRQYWRKSYAGKKWGLWWELQLGTNDRRYTIRLKIKRVKVFEETIKN